MHASATTLAACILVVTLTATFGADENWGLTKFDVKYVNYSFPIGQYSLNNKQNGDPITSKITFSRDSSDFKWNVVVYPRGRDAGSDRFTAVYLKLKKKPDHISQILLNMQFSIIDKYGKKVNVKSVKNNRYIQQGNSFGIRNFVEHSTIEVAYKDTWLPNDVLTVHVEFEFSVGLQRASTQCSTIEVECTSLPYSNDYLHDTDIWVGQGIHAHKAALIAHSKWFELQMSFNPTQVSFALPGKSPQLIRDVLDFIYKGKTKTDQDSLQQLLKFADEYKMDQLKLYVERNLCILMTGRNADALSSLARDYNAVNLKREADNFIFGLNEGVVR